jgi:hypothetical protein
VKKYPVYEGDDVLEELNNRPYYNSFQAKLYYLPESKWTDPKADGSPDV